jgi:hypothetical protein
LLREEIDLALGPVGTFDIVPGPGFLELFFQVSYPPRVLSFGTGFENLARMTRLHPKLGIGRGPRSST